MNESKLLSLVEYCSQNIRDIVKNTSMIIDAGAPKIEVLSKAASAYLERKYITEETFKVLKDPRFIRLYNARVSLLQKLLAERKITTPKQGKAKIVEMCYMEGIDISIEDSFYHTNNSSSTDSEDSECYHCEFMVDNGEIYVTIENKKYKISKRSITELFSSILCDFIQK